MTKTPVNNESAQTHCPGCSGSPYDGARGKRRRRRVIGGMHRRKTQVISARPLDSLASRPGNAEGKEERDRGGGGEEEEEEEEEEGANAGRDREEESERERESARARERVVDNEHVTEGL
jgi:hypothetical protein